MDTQLERYERELLRLRARKTRIMTPDIEKVGLLWDGMRPLIQAAQDALSDFIGLVNY